MNFNGVKVLLTDGGARQTLTILHGLKEIGCHITVLCSTKLDVCYNSKLPDARILDYDAAGSHDGFETFIMKVLKEGHFDVLLPVAEITTNKVTLHEDEIKQYVKIACAPRAAYIQAFNKQRTFEKALDLGIPCPYTRRESQTVEEYLSKAKFPVIIKPRQGLGSIGFHKFETREEFDKALADKTFNPDEYVIQEFVKFERRIGTYIFMDQNCKTCASSVQEVLRWYPIDAGTAVLTRTIDEPDAIRHSCELLKALEWHGFANVGFMVDSETGEAKLLEINGRISAGVKLSWFCGINIAKQLMEMAYDQEVTVYPENTKFGLMARHSHADISWFLKSKERFSCKPSWFSWKNTTDLVYWKHDIKPYFTYTLQKIFRYKEDINKRKH